MDPIFDRLGRLIRSFTQDDDSSDTVTGSSDQDMKDAWDELNDFLDEGKEKQKHQSQQKNYSGNYKTGTHRPSSEPEALRKDYKFLGVPFGVDLKSVEKEYRKLILKWHPDRHGGSEESVSKATEMTQRINEAFQRIEKYKETGQF